MGNYPPQTPFYRKTKGAEIKWFAYSRRERAQLKHDGNKSSQPVRSQVLGVKVQRKLPTKYRGINNAQRGHQLDAHWREKKEFEALNHQPVPTDWGGTVGGS